MKIQFKARMLTFSMALFSLILIHNEAWSNKIVAGEYPARFRTVIPQRRVSLEAALAVEVDRTTFFKPDGTLDLVLWGEVVMAVSKTVSLVPDLDIYIEYDVKESDNMNLDAKKHIHLVRAQRFFAYLNPPIIQGSNEMSYNLKWVSKIYVHMKKNSDSSEIHKRQIRNLEVRLTKDLKAYVRTRRNQPTFETPPITLSEIPPVHETLDSNPGFVFGPGVEKNTQLIQRLRSEAQLTDDVVARIVDAGGEVLDFFSAIRIAQGLTGIPLQRPMIRTPGDQEPALPLIDHTVIEFPAINETVRGVSLNLESHFTNPSGVMTTFLGMKDWRWTYPFALTLTTYQKKGTPEQELVRFQVNTTNVINALITANLPLFILVPPHWNDENYKNSVTSVEMRWLIDHLDHLKEKRAKVYFVVGAYQYRTLSQSYSAMRIAAEADAKAKGIQAIGQWDTMVKTADDVSIEELLKHMGQRLPHHAIMQRCEGYL